MNLKNMQKCGYLLLKNWVEPIMNIFYHMKVLIILQ